MSMQTGSNGTNDELPTLHYHLQTLETSLGELKMQLGSFVLERENNLKLQAVHESVTRIEVDIQITKVDMQTTKQKLIEMSSDILTQGAAQRESQDKLQIRMLYGAVSIVIAILTSVLVYYITQVLLHH